MKLTLPEMKMKGRYRMELVDAETGEIDQDTGWFDNLITNDGLNRIGNIMDTTSTLTNIFESVGLTSIHVGRGSTPPTVFDASLEEHVSTSNSSFSSENSWDWGGGYFIYSRTQEFSAGRVEGLITEVGCGPTNNLFSRALIESGGIFVNASQVLRVQYELRINFPLLGETVFQAILEHDDNSVPVTVKVAPIFMASNLDAGLGSTSTNNRYWNITSDGRYWSFYSGYTNYTSRAVARNGGNQHFSQSGAGNTVRSSAVQNFPYVFDSYEYKIGYTWNTSTANWDQGIVGIDWNSPFLGAWQFEFDAPIPKTSNNVFYIELVAKWGRA